jgi:hypothetical protein
MPVLMKTKSAQKSDLPPAQRIQEAYIDSVLTDGKDPVSVYHFARKAGLTEEEFYNEFSGFEGVALSVWKTHLTQVIQSTESNPEYPEFQTREKILLFYFTFFQEFRKIRSYAAYSASRWALPFSKDKIILRPESRKVLPPENWWSGLKSVVITTKPFDLSFF